METVIPTIGITGGNGFVGWHLRCYLHSLNISSKVLIAGRETFENASLLDGFVSKSDVIFHLAAVNRSENEQELGSGNLKPANQLVDALKRCQVSPTIIYTNTTHAENPVNAYGEAKANVAKTLGAWADENDGVFHNVIVPHVFGEYGKPFYNSAMATFCHQVVNGGKLSISSDGKLELLHVQDLVEALYRLTNCSQSSLLRLQGRTIGVQDVASKLISMFASYENGIWPELSNKMDLDLFNALRGSIEHNKRKVTAELHSDERGWLVETMKAGSGGQCFVSTTHPGITRGNHYHRRKVERFFVLKGKAEIKIRKLFSEDVHSFTAGAHGPEYIDIPTLHTHNITNVGYEELVTLFWTNEFYDPKAPDTFFEEV